jgi:trehalose-phosphatase
VQYLFKSWEAIRKNIIKAKSLFLLLDYDGTLTPIVKKPELAVLNPRVRATLRKLTGYTNVFIISGRELKDVKNMVRIKELNYVGNHGLEIQLFGKKLLRLYGKREIENARKIKDEFKKSFSHIKGVLVEDKGVIIAVHYRNVSKKNVPEIIKTVKNKCRKYGLTTGEGKKVIEARPRIARNKGTAIKFILKKVKPCKNSALFYFGDDITDEDAFKVIRKRGTGVFVGRRKSRSFAKYFVKSPDDVARFLREILTLKPGQSAK